MTELGASGIAVSPIALGSWRTFERMKRQDAERVLTYAIEHGITFLDDARYDDETGRAPIATGYSEVLFGQLFRAAGASLESVAVANKLWWEFWPQQTAVDELEGSLERMGFERLSLLYSMNLPEEVSVGLAVEQMADVLATGRVAAWGVVNWSAEQLAAAGREAVNLGLSQPCAVQLPYNVARTDWIEDPAMEDALEQTGASLIPSTALAGGALSGKYADGESEQGRLSGELEDPRRARALAIGAALREPARRRGVSPATLAIAFTLRHPRTASTLIGTTRTEQIDDALAAVTLAERLSEEDISTLRALPDALDGANTAPELFPP
jgi:aryl-alcohol dehydrogenase-like predicted oxidoreductase